MKRIYSRFRITLMAFALGMATVYMGNGLSIERSEIPVQLPLVSSGEVLEVMTPDLRERPRRYVCDEEHDDDAHAACIHKAIFADRDMSLYGNGGYAGCVSANLIGKLEYLSCRERSLVRARSFVWDHWKDKKRGHIIVSFVGDGKIFDTHLFVEPDDHPDAAGRWRIVERTMPKLAYDPHGENLGLSDLHEVKWKRATRDDARFGPTLGTLFLQLTDDAGDSLDL